MQRLLEEAEEEEEEEEEEAVVGGRWNWRSCVNDLHQKATGIFIF